MLGRVELHGRTDLHIVSDDDGSAVKKGAVMIDEDVPAKTDIVAVVAGKGGKNHGSFADRAQEIPKQGIAKIFTVIRRFIVLGQYLLCTASLNEQLPISGTVQLSREHLILFGLLGHQIRLRQLQTGGSGRMPHSSR